MPSRIISSESLISIDKRLEINTQIDNDIISKLSDFSEMMPGVAAGLTRLSIESIDIHDKVTNINKELETKADLNSTFESILNVTSELTRLTNYYYENKVDVDTLKLSFFSLDEKVNVLIGMGIKQLSNQNTLDSKLNSIITKLQISSPDTINPSLDGVVKINSSYNALIGNTIIADTSSNTIIIRLPNNPKIGDVVTIIDSTHSFGIHPVTITSSDLINGSSNPLVVNNQVELVFMYSGTLHGWVEVPVMYPVNPIFIDTTSNIFAHANNIILANTENGSFAVNLPINPIVGDTVTILDINRSFDTYPLTVNAQDSLINGVQPPLILRTNIPVTFRYSGILYGWITIPSSNFSITDNIVNTKVDYRSSNKDYILADTTLGSFIISLPANPALSDSITIIDPNNTWDTNPLIIDPLTNNINSVSGTQKISATHKVTFTYFGPPIGWMSDPINLTSGVYSAGTPNVISVNTNYISNPKDYVLVDLTNGPINIKLPANPSISDMVSVLDTKGLIGFNPITFDPNGHKILGSYSPLTISNQELITFIYTGPTYGWVLTNIYDSGSWSFVNKDLTVTDSSNILVDTSNESIKVTLPANPVEFTYITIVDMAGTFELHPCSLDGNGYNILNTPVLDIDVNNISITFMFEGSQWLIVDKIGSPKYINSNTTAQDKDQLIVDTSLNTITINLPESPTDNTSITISDLKGTFNTNNCIIKATHTINMDTTTMILDINFSSICLIFISGRWLLKA